MRKKYYDDAKENAAFERGVDVVTALILKYGPAIKRKWILRDWIKNIQADCFWMRIPLERNSLHASAGRLSAPNGKFFKLHWITHVLAI